MTIRQVHPLTGCPPTLEEWRALDPDNPTRTGNGPRRPLTGSGWIGSTTAGRREADATASSCFTESDRPAMRAGPWRAVGPRGHATDLEYINAERARNTRITAPVPVSEAQPVETDGNVIPLHKRNTDPSRGTNVPRTRKAER